MDLIKRLYCELVEVGDRTHFWLVNGPILYDLQSDEWKELNSQIKNLSLTEFCKRIENKFNDEDNVISRVFDHYHKIKNKIYSLHHTSDPSLLSVSLSTVFTEENIKEATGGMTYSELFIDDDYLKTVPIVISKYRYYFYIFI